jgi:lipoyl(octanoyl) transferase
MSLLEWKVTPGLTDYQTALLSMENHVEAIFKNKTSDLIWLLEHPSVYTAGTNTKPEDLEYAKSLPIVFTGRGGRITFHGPGQRVCYIIMNLKNKNPDLRKFIYAVEEWIIQTLKTFHIVGERRQNRIGIWVTHLNKNGVLTESKIAAIGIRVRHWITFHGFALNIHPDLNAFSPIIPCGISEYGVTSLKDLGVFASFQEVDRALNQTFSCFLEALS